MEASHSCISTYRCIGNETSHVKLAYPHVLSNPQLLGYGDNSVEHVGFVLIIFQIGIPWFFRTRPRRNTVDYNVRGIVLPLSLLICFTFFQQKQV